MEEFKITKKEEQEKVLRNPFSKIKKVVLEKFTQLNPII